MSATTRHFFLAALILSVSPCLVTAANGQSKDPFLGKWTLDSDHSQFSPGAVPMGSHHDARNEGRQSAQPHRYGGEQWRRGYYRIHREAGWRRLSHRWHGSG